MKKPTPSKGADIDTLLKRVQEKPGMSIKQLSAEFGVSASLLERWAVMLEENGLIAIEYSATSSPTLISGNAEEAEKKKVKKPSSFGPTMIMTIALAAIIGLFFLQYTGLMDFKPAQSKDSINMTADINTPSLTTVQVTNKFSRTGTASYTAVVSYRAANSENYKVYIKDGNIRVDNLEYNEYQLCNDEACYHVFEDEGWWEEISREDFELETTFLMPWTYLDELNSASIGGSRSIVDGRECRNFDIKSGLVCLMMDTGFPLKFSGQDMTIIFKDLDINANIPDDLFEI